MYTVVPIRCGAMAATKSFLTYRVDGDVTYEFAIFVFVLLPDDETSDVVLVDTGVSPTEAEYMQNRGRTVGPPGGGPDPIVAGLAEHDLEPDNVDRVVLTHLHHDHAANLDLFEDAVFVVQKRELEAVRNPLPITAASYIDGTLAFLESATLRAVDGDVSLTDGIDLLFTPGHTEGSQTVIVETEDGPVALIADLAYCRHNLDPRVSSIVDASGRTVEVTPQDMDYIPPGIHIDIADCYESIARIRDRIGDAGVLLPSHDPSIVDRL